jgi:hypothetical protein
MARHDTWALAGEGLSLPGRHYRHRAMPALRFGRIGGGSIARTTMARRKGPMPLITLKTMDATTTALLLDLALAVLATAILVVRYVVRKRDVIHGRFIEEKISDDDGCTSQYRRRMSPGSLTGFGGLTNGQYAAGRTVANAPASRAIWSRDLGASRDEQ